MDIFLLTLLLRPKVIVHWCNVDGTLFDRLPAGSLFFFSFLQGHSFFFSFLQGHSGRWLVGTQLQDGRPLTLSLETTDDVKAQLGSHFNSSPAQRGSQTAQRLWASLLWHWPGAGPHPKHLDAQAEVHLVLFCQILSIQLLGRTAHLQLRRLLLKTQEHKNPGYSRKSRPRFHGSCLMQLQALATQQMLTFHSDELAINLVNVSLTEMGSQPEPFLPQQIILDFQRTFVTLVLPGERPFQAGKTYNLLVEFSSTKRRGNQTWWNVQIVQIYLYKFSPAWAVKVLLELVLFLQVWWQWVCLWLPPSTLHTRIAHAMLVSRAKYAFSFCQFYLGRHKLPFQVHTTGVNLCPECLSLLWRASHESLNFEFWTQTLWIWSQAEFTMYVGRSPDYRSLSNMPLKTVSFSLSVIKHQTMLLLRPFLSPRKIPQRRTGCWTSTTPRWRCRPTWWPSSSLGTISHLSPTWLRAVRSPRSTITYYSMNLEIDSTSLHNIPNEQQSLSTFRCEIVRCGIFRCGLLQRTWKPAELIMRLLLDLLWSSFMKTPMASSEIPATLLCWDSMCIQLVPSRHFLFPRYPLSKMDMLSQTDQPGVAMEVWQKSISQDWLFSNLTRIGASCYLRRLACWLTQTVQMRMPGRCSPPNFD